MSIRERMRLLGSGIGDEALAREAGFLKSQDVADAEKLRAATRADLLVIRANADAATMKIRSEARSASSALRRSTWQNLYREMADTLGIQPIALAFLLLGVALVLPFALYPVRELYIEGTVNRYTLQAGVEGTQDSTVFTYTVRYKPKGALYSEEKIWLPGATPMVAQAKFEELQAMYGDTIDFRLVPELAQAQCWNVVRVMDWGHDEIVSPCYVDYASAVAVLNGFEKGTSINLGKSVLDANRTPHPTQGVALFEPKPVATTGVPVVDAVTRVVVVPESLVYEYFDAHQITEETDASYLMDLDPDEVVMVGISDQ